MRKILLILVLACCSGLAKAETIDEHFGVAPGTLNSANVRAITGYATMQGAYYAWQASEDMAAREKAVQADRAAYNKYLAAYFTKIKDEAAAQQLAEIDNKRTASHTYVTVYGPHGDTTIRYDGLGNPTDRVDTSYEINRTQTTHRNLESH